MIRAAIPTTGGASTMTRRLCGWASMLGGTPRWTGALAIVLAGFAMAPAGAAAATGDLTQPAGTLGCVEFHATGAAEGCQEATFGFGLQAADVVGTFGTSVYVGSSSSIEVLQRDSSDAGLSDVQCLQATSAEGCAEAPALEEASIRQIAVSPDGKSAYVTAISNGQDEIVVFSRNTTTGALTQLSGTASCLSDLGENAQGAGTCTEVPTPHGGDDYYAVGLYVAVSPNGKYVYSDGSSGGAITVYERDTQAGAGFGSLIPITADCVIDAIGDGCTTTLPIVGEPRGPVAITPDGKFIYFEGSDGSIGWLHVDPTTGTLSNGTSPDEGCVQDESADSSGCANPAIHGLLEPTGSIVLSPDANASFVYAVSGGEDQPGDITVLPRNPKTGVLSQVSGQNGCAGSTGSDNEVAPQNPQSCDTLASIADAETLVASPDGQNL